MSIYDYPSWKWDQLRGMLHDPAGHLEATGYSGHDAGKNNPAMEHSLHLGPIPKGLWTIGWALAPGGRLGELALPLEPYLGTQTFGRTGFAIHGDDVKEGVLEHSQDRHHGCLVLPKAAREMLDRTIYRLLLVE